MTNQPRAARILVCLVVAMTAGAAILMALDHQSISAGAFSLASYSSLGPISDIIATKEPANINKWKKIEVFYSSNPEDLNFHFLVCNSLGGIDGQIHATEKWLNQWSAIPSGNWYGNGNTIRICVIGEGQKAASDYQMSRTEELIQELSRKFNIHNPKGEQL